MLEQSVLISLNNKVRKIVLHRPKRKNAFTAEMYQTIIDTLKQDAENDEIVVTILTGTGDFYSSGNDFKESLKGTAKLDLIQQFVQSFIDYPKLLIAVLNGPAIGIAATTAILCDIVYASDRAYLETPFIKLALCAEGTSSYTFPRIIGRSKASEMLLLGKRINAEEAERAGMIAKIFPHVTVDSFISDLSIYGNLPVGSLKLNKQLMIGPIRDQLTKANFDECTGLEVAAETEEFQERVLAMFTKSSKL